MKMIYSSIRIIILLAFVCTFSSCKINYSFSGASISPEMKTFSVASIDNRAPLFHPTLALTLEENLKDKILNQSSLKLVTSEGDADFSGEISDYFTQPMAIQGNDKAAQTRLSVTIKIKYIDNKEPKNSYSQTFTRYEDFGADENLSQVEDELIKKIVEQLSEDIFNKAFVNW